MTAKAALAKSKSKSAGPLFADLALATRLEAAMVAMLAAFEKTVRKYHPENRSVALEDICGGKMLFAGLGSPVNHAIGMGLTKPVNAADFDRVETFYSSRGAPVEIMACPFAGIEFAQMLAKRGYRPNEFENVLVLSLKDWKPKSVAPNKKGVRLRIRKNTNEQATLATEVVINGFDQMSMPPEIRNTLEDFQRLPNNLCYMAYADDTPIASAAGFISPRHKVALLYGTSTMPKFRNLGAQTLLLQARLKEAAAAGCELASISTLPGTTSQHNAERAGFRVAYTLTTYVLTEFVAQPPSAVRS